MPTAIPKVISGPRPELGDQPAGERRDEDHRRGDRQHLEPADERRVAAHVLQVLGLEVDHRPVGADQAEGGGAGAEVRAVAEEVELDDRRPHPVLDQPEGGERDEPDDGQRDHRRRAQASDWTRARTTRVRPRLSAPRPGQSILWPGARVGRLGGGAGDDQHPDRDHRQVHQEDHPPVDFDQRAADQRPDRERRGGDRRPRSRAPSAPPLRGRRCRRGRARAPAPAPPPRPAGCVRGSDVRVPGQAGDDRADAEARASRAGRAARRPNMSPSRPAVTTSTEIVSR